MRSTARSCLPGLLPPRVSIWLFFDDGEVVVAEGFKWLPFGRPTFEGQFVVAGVRGKLVNRNAQHEGPVFLWRRDDHGLNVPDGDARAAQMTARLRISRFTLLTRAAAANSRVRAISLVRSFCFATGPEATRK